MNNSRKKGEGLKIPLVRQTMGENEMKTLNEFRRVFN